MKRAFRYDGHFRRLAIVALGAMLAMLLAACGGGDDEDSGGSSKKVDVAAELKKPATITVWAWTPGTLSLIHI